MVGGEKFENLVSGRSQKRLGNTALDLSKNIIFKENIKDMVR